MMESGQNSSTATAVFVRDTGRTEEIRREIDCRGDNHVHTLQEGEAIRI